MCNITLKEHYKVLSCVLMWKSTKYHIRCPKVSGSVMKNEYRIHYRNYIQIMV